MNARPDPISLHHSNDKYDAFISYSHSADARVAAAVQAGLERLAKPWYRRHVLRVFRDDTDLTASPGLWSAIERAIDQSGAFVLIASPEAAASRWVEQEVMRWSATKSINRLFVAVAAGSVHWDSEARDFDWTQTTAIPRTLSGSFTEEPLYVDLRFARDENSASLRNPRFRTAVARLGAPLRGLALDDLISEDVRLHRRAVRLAVGAVVALVILTIVAVISALLAGNWARLAERRLTTAISRRVALEGMVAELVNQQPDLGLLLSLQSQKIEPNTVAQRNILTVLASVNESEVYLRAPPERTLRAVTFASDGTRVSAISDRDEFFSWRLLTPRDPPQLLAFSEKHGVYLARDEMDVLVPLEGEMVVVDRTSRIGVATDDSVRTFRIGEGPLAVLPIEADQVQSVAISRGGATVGLGGRDGTISLWNTRTGRHQRTISPAGTKSDTVIGIGSLALSPDAKRIAVAEADGTLRLWDLTGGSPKEEVLSHLYTQAVRVVFNDDATSLFVAYGSNVERWNIATRHSEILGGFSGQIQDLALSSDGSHIAAVGREAILVWSFAEREMFRRAFDSPHVASVVAAAMLSDGVHGRTLDYDRLLVDWDFSKVPTTVRSARLVSGHGGLAQFSRDGRWLVASEPDPRQIVRWDLASPTPVRQAVVSSPRPIHALAFSASGEVLAIASEGATVQVCRFDGDTVVTVWSDNLDESVSTLAIDRNGNWLAGGYEAGGFFVRNLRSGQQQRTKDAHEGRITGLAFNEQGGLLATAGEDQMVGVWRVPALSLVGKLRSGHSGTGAISVSFNPVTGQLVSSGGDSVIYLWPPADQDDQAVPLPLIGHERPAHALAFSCDGRRLLTGDGNWRVFLWEIDPDLWEERACGIVNRNLTKDEWRMHIGTMPYQKTCKAVDIPGEARHQLPPPRR